MMLAKGRNAGGNKQWGRKVTCSYRDCSTNTKDSDRRMFPFPKPCSAYVHSLIDPERSEHSVNECERCAKSFRWIQLCGNAGITNLEDVNARTYVCVKHFEDETGPTLSCPDPLPSRCCLPDVKPSRVRRERRAPSPLVEAIPFVEAVYDSEAVSQRIQQAIEQEGQHARLGSQLAHAAPSQNQPNLQGQLALERIETTRLGSQFAHTASSQGQTLDTEGPNLREQLALERLETARLAGKLARCQATSKRRLQTIRQLKARLKAAERGGAKGDT